MSTANKGDDQDNNWSLVIKPYSSLFDLHLRDIWRYRDLLYMFVKRDFIAVYKQTILGPIWFILQPLIMTVVFTFVFGRVAKLAPEGLPTMLFYLSGIVSWNFFADCLKLTASTFITNRGIFGKVYFPRLVTPISIVISTFLKFCIQFLLFIGIYMYFIYDGTDVYINAPLALAFTPILIIITAGLGLGSGIIISSITTKYRDFTFLVGFGVQLLMYLSPVIYPLKTLEKEFGVYADIVKYINPMSPIIETFRYIYLGENGGMNPMENIPYLLFSVGTMLVLLLVGIVIFNRVEKTFMDTV